MECRCIFESGHSRFYLLFIQRLKKSFIHLLRSSIEITYYNFDVYMNTLSRKMQMWTAQKSIMILLNTYTKTFIILLEERDVFYDCWRDSVTIFTHQIIFFFTYYKLLQCVTWYLSLTCRLQPCNLFHKLGGLIYDVRGNKQWQLVKNILGGVVCARSLR